MPYADNGSVRIFYQVEGEGPALVLQHGFTESVVDWYETGYVEALRSDYRLILIDARGHGASDKPHDPDAYVLNRRVADVVTVLDDAFTFRGKQYRSLSLIAREITGTRWNGLVFFGIRRSGART